MSVFLSISSLFFFFYCLFFSFFFFFFFSSRRRHTRCSRDWSSDVCSSDLFWRDAGDLFWGNDHVFIFFVLVAFDDLVVGYRSITFLALFLLADGSEDRKSVV